MSVLVGATFPLPKNAPGHIHVGRRVLGACVNFSRRLQLCTILHTRIGSNRLGRDGAQSGCRLHRTVLKRIVLKRITFKRIAKSIGLRSNPIQSDPIRSNSSVRRALPEAKHLANDEETLGRRTNRPLQKFVTSHLWKRLVPLRMIIGVISGANMQGHGRDFPALSQPDKPTTKREWNRGGGVEAVVIRGRAWVQHRAKVLEGDLFVTIGHPQEHEVARMREGKGASVSVTYVDREQRCVSMHQPFVYFIHGCFRGKRKHNIVFAGARALRIFGDYESETAGVASQRQYPLLRRHGTAKKINSTIVHYLGGLPVPSLRKSSPPPTTRR